MTQGGVPHPWPKDRHHPNMQVALPRSGRSAGLSLLACRSTGQFVDGTSQSRKVNNCILPGKNTPSYTLKNLLSHSQTLFPIGNRMSLGAKTAQLLSSWICFS